MEKTFAVFKKSGHWVAQKIADRPEDVNYAATDALVADSQGNRGQSSSDWVLAVAETEERAVAKASLTPMGQSSGKICSGQAYHLFCGALKP